ncbi:gamma-glutamyl-gamma-aminobutyrate hydrolase family protein [Streptomyces sp. TRM66268-LWL]|uniref:CTP synthase (glutamine hydrolyzing) n=1 Tax=Streptomyces polyasparticus TaxID=2767826 RepID=A0ABR7SQT4_9ACTN|nr:gamma-glutamyl-gamma-aminobutyrate hydrolase family protein [Streptomyces polyasparticus]MBC9716952.1 gamma-glutamyl-gamma-aminobutyrate hydrolase family protein [Streptomyces polyasparticus]
MPNDKDTPQHTARIALVGDRSPNVRSHTRIPGLLDALREREYLDLEAYWIPTEEAAAEGVEGFDGIWVLPGSPYRSEAGALRAVRTARERGIPFLGTCGGFQHAVLEFARGVCGLTDAVHAETDPGTERQVIAPLACSLVGHEGAVHFAPDSLVRQLLGTERSLERYHCSYALAEEYRDTLHAHGLRFTGTDDEGAVRVAELPNHPFFLATLFQPELSGDGTRPHPLIHGFAAAALREATAAKSTV